MDYWNEVDLQEHQNWESFVVKEQPERLWLFTTKSTHSYWDAHFQHGDYLLFGSEQHGVPEEIHEWVTKKNGQNARLCLPMERGARSLNLATVVCTAVYEGLRQLSQS